METTSNHTISSILEYLQAEDQQLCQIGMVLLNNADLPIEYKLSILKKADYTKDSSKTQMIRMDKSYSFDNNIFEDNTAWDYRISLTRAHEALRKVQARNLPGRIIR